MKQALTEEKALNAQRHEDILMPFLPLQLNLLHPPLLPDSSLFLFALFPSTLFTFLFG